MGVIKVETYIITSKEAYHDLENNKLGMDVSTEI
jgi:hypothetical protein